MKNISLIAILILVHYVGFLYISISDMYKNTLMLPNLLVKIIFVLNNFILINICLYNLFNRSIKHLNLDLNNNYYYCHFFKSLNFDANTCIKYINMYESIYIIIFCLAVIYYYKKKRIKQISLNIMQEQKMKGVKIRSNEILTKLQIYVYVFTCYNPVLVIFSKLTISYAALLAFEFFKPILAT